MLCVASRKPPPRCSLPARSRRTSASMSGRSWRAWAMKSRSASDAGTVLSAVERDTYMSGSLSARPPTRMKLSPPPVVSAFDEALPRRLAGSAATLGDLIEFGLGELVVPGIRGWTIGPPRAIFGSRLTNQPGAYVCPARVPHPDTRRSARTWPRLVSAWWAYSCPPHDAPRRTRPVPRGPRARRGPLNRPCKSIPPIAA